MLEYQLRLSIKVSQISAPRSRSWVHQPLSYDSVLP